MFDYPITAKEPTIKCQMSVQFYEKITRRASWWPTKTAESEICWEKWELNCEFLSPSRTEHGISSFIRGLKTDFAVEKVKAQTIMEEQLASALWKIVVLTQKTDHIPPITTNEANPLVLGPRPVWTAKVGALYLKRHFLMLLPDRASGSERNGG
jgi:autophagy-related protein 101